MLRFGVCAQRAGEIDVAQGVLQLGREVGAGQLSGGGRGAKFLVMWE